MSTSGLIQGTVSGNAGLKPETADTISLGIALTPPTIRGLSLTLTNLFDSRGNRFSLGTPFVEGNEGFLTPLRPRTLRIAVDVSY